MELLISFLPTSAGLGLLAWKQTMKEELKRMWKVKAKFVPVVVWALGAMTLKLGDTRNNIRGLCPEKFSARNNNILCRTLKLSGIW